MDDDLDESEEGAENDYIEVHAVYFSREPHNIKQFLDERRRHKSEKALKKRNQRSIKRINLPTPGWWKRSLPSTKRSIIAWTSIAVSVAGILLATALDTACHGGRGGAIAIILILLMLLFRDHKTEGALSSESFWDHPTDYDRLAELRGGLAVILDRQNRITSFQVVATAVATFAWGFGDLIAAFMGASAC